MQRLVNTSRWTGPLSKWRGGDAIGYSGQQIQRWNGKRKDTHDLIRIMSEVICEVI